VSSGSTLVLDAIAIAGQIMIARLLTLVPRFARGGWAVVVATAAG
jgi:hypothetical protein